MSFESQVRLLNGSANRKSDNLSKMEILNKELREKKYVPEFHGDNLLGEPTVPSGLISRLLNNFDSLRSVFQPKNTFHVGKVVAKMLAGEGLDVSRLKI